MQFLQSQIFYNVSVCRAVFRECNLSALNQVLRDQFDFVVVGLPIGSIHRVSGVVILPPHMVCSHQLVCLHLTPELKHINCKGWRCSLVHLVLFGCHAPFVISSVVRGSPQSCMLVRQKCFSDKTWIISNHKTKGLSEFLLAANMELLLSSGLSCAICAWNHSQLKDIHGQGKYSWEDGRVYEGQWDRTALKGSQESFI